jgi:L-alanine-DL-glutamate epimerase-like enolase superfamily enzyme
VRIERLEVHPIAIPLLHPYRDATRVEWHSRDVLVRLVAEDGAAGWGAGTPRRFPTGETQVGTVHVLERVLAEVIIGRDPADTAGMLGAMESAIPGNYAAKAAVDIAVHDLLARARGVPVHALLGERLRETASSLDILPLGPPARMAAHAAELHDRLGTRAFKVKIDQDVAAGIDRVEAVREAVPDAMLVADANGVWSIEEAIDACELLAMSGVRVVEQPTPGHDIDALAEVTRRSPIAIAADESAQPIFVDRLIAMRAANVVNVKLTREGGFGPALSVARRATAAGLEVVCGSVVQGSLVDAACAHLFAVMPTLAYNESGKAPAWHAEDVAVGLRVADGLVHVPTAAGLGVEVDPAAVRRLRPTD